MNKSITQDNQNDNQILKSIKRFFTRFHISSALKASNAYKKKGTPVIELFQYLLLPRSMTMQSMLIAILELLTAARTARNCVEDQDISCPSWSK